MPELWRHFFIQTGIFNGNGGPICQALDKSDILVVDGLRRAAFERQLAALGGRPPLAVRPSGSPSNGPTCSEVVERANAGYPDAPGNSGAIAKK